MQGDGIGQAPAATNALSMNANYMLIGDGSPQTGIVKAWKEERGMGFITPTAGGEDVFVHRSQLTDGQSLVQGATVTYTSAWDSQKNKPVALAISGATANALGAAGPVLAQAAAAAPGLANTLASALQTAANAAASDSTNSNSGSVLEVLTAAVQALNQGGGAPPGQPPPPSTPHPSIAMNPAWHGGKDGGKGGGKPVADPSKNLFVAGLPAHADEAMVRSIFGAFGTVESCKVLPPDPRKPDRVSMVSFASASEAQWMVDNMNGSIPAGLDSQTPLVVKFATQKSWGGDGKGGDGKGWDGGKGWDSGKGYDGKGYDGKGYGKTASKAWDNSRYDPYAAFGSGGSSGGWGSDGGWGKGGGKGDGWGGGKGDGWGGGKGDGWGGGTSSSSGTGTVKAWMEDRGMGFITPAHGGPDLFVHRSQVADGESLVVGAHVSFEESWDYQKNKPIANKVRTGGAPSPPAGPQVVPARVKPGGAPGGDESFFGAAGDGSAQAQQGAAAGGPPPNMPEGPQLGKVMAWFENRGMGFIKAEGDGTDFFVHRSVLTDGNALTVGSVVTFEASWDVKKNKAIAKSCSGATTKPEGA
eukprot:gnl/TRDRNA2_/TRDRNA2_51601_c0_seq1.p1 gnl/TRDRNA2_/TRDRNA2_51601_c0~~gnl/TRDRNA2_/TRDRNA2_51601_c0_seq1.p1  ORF type:complete len:584 (-),score=123.34 gnl/TRDRNA2_/TRDRNA2_51601_c0_seq1:61-1812(-)